MPDLRRVLGRRPAPTARAGRALVMALLILGTVAALVLLIPAALTIGGSMGFVVGSGID